MYKNTVFVTWYDAEGLYQRRTEVVKDVEDILVNGVLKTTIFTEGFTTREQARRLGLWVLQHKNTRCTYEEKSSG